MVVFPPCKINLGLAIVSKRTDGYHNLETCFYPVPLTDILEIVSSDNFGFTCSGLAVPGNEDSNLVVKAYQLLQAEHRLPPVLIHLHKIVPMGAGLGGGSSDAAYTLRVLNAIFELNLSSIQLKDYALALGSDCPFFLFDAPMIGRGRGEQLTPTNINLAGQILVLVVPPIHVSTAHAFSGVVPKEPTVDINNVLRGPATSWMETLHNDFEASVFHQYPEIALCKQRLLDAGAVYASLTGTGSGVYGIFDSMPQAIEDLFPAAAVWSLVLT